MLFIAICWYSLLSDFLHRVTVNKYVGYFLRERNIITNNYFAIKDVAAGSLISGKRLMEKRLYVLPLCPDYLPGEALHQTVVKIMHYMWEFYLWTEVAASLTMAETYIPFCFIFVIDVSVYKHLFCFAVKYFYLCMLGLWCCVFWMLKIEGGNFYQLSLFVQHF